VFISSFVSVSDAAVIIDFESFNLNNATFLDVASPLVFDNVGGSGVTVTMNEGIDFRIYDLFAFGGDLNAVGQALIDMSWGTFTNSSGTDILFSSPVSGFSLRAGDFGSDGDSPLRIEAFDAGNVSLGVATALWPAVAFPPFATLSLDVAGIRRIHYSSNGTFTGSTFIDDITFTASETPVPEPGSFLLVLAGIGLLALTRRNTIG
jgi:hypothetical protein